MRDAQKRGAELPMRDRDTQTESGGGGGQKVCLLKRVILKCVCTRGINGWFAGENMPNAV